jgi:hypothetical protein
MHHSFATYMASAMPLFFFPSMALVLARPLFEFILPRQKDCTPSRIVSLLQGALCAALLTVNDYESAIASTVIYFFADLGFNWAFGKVERLPMVIHHVCGALICMYSLHTHSWHKKVEGDITRSLILMETTNISFQTSMILYNEFGHVPAMVPAMLHFLVVRVLCLGYSVNPFNMTIIRYVMETSTLKFYYFIALSLWAMQVFWFVTWVCKVVIKLGFKEEKWKGD